MAHKITIMVPSFEVKGTDVVITIATDEDGKLGELHISKGNIQWKPKGKSTTRYSIAWSDIPTLFEEHGKDMSQ